MVLPKLLSQTALGEPVLFRALGVTISRCHVTAAPPVFRYQPFSNHGNGVENDSHRSMHDNPLPSVRITTSFTFPKPPDFLR